MSGDGELCMVATIVNQRGLHARAAVRFVQLAESFDAEVAVIKDEMRVSGRSIMGLMMLAASTGTQIGICCAGREAAAAQAALADLVRRKFDEE